MHAREPGRLSSTGAVAVGVASWWPRLSETSGAMTTGETAAPSWMQQSVDLDAELLSFILSSNGGGTGDGYWSPSGSGQGRCALQERLLPGGGAGASMRLSMNLRAGVVAVSSRHLRRVWSNPRASFNELRSRWAMLSNRAR